jgi:hypothetical protein
MNELRTLGSLVDALSRHGDQPAVLALHEESIERWSYAELAGQVMRLASGVTEKVEAPFKEAGEEGGDGGELYPD